jgi:hypothetical protein
MSSRKITVKTIRTKIKKTIKIKFGMSVYEFARSGEPEKLGLNGRNIESVLSDSGSVSSPTFEKLYNLLGLGKLNHQTIVKRETIFYEG